MYQLTIKVKDGTDIIHYCHDVWVADNHYLQWTLLDENCALRIGGGGTTDWISYEFEYYKTEEVI